MSSTNLAVARQTFGAGNLGRAEQALGLPASIDLDAAVLRAELLYLRGYADRGLRLAEELLPRAERFAGLKAQLLFIAGASASEVGDRARGKERLERAAVLARDIDDWSLLSRVQLKVLELSADGDQPYDLSLPLCATAIRSVHRAGDQRVLADAHVTFARLEARSGAVDQAARHLSHVKRIVGDSGESWVGASGKLTAAIVFSLQGNLQSA